MYQTPPQLKCTKKNPKMYQKSPPGGFLPRGFSGTFWGVVWGVFWYILGFFFWYLAGGEGLVHFGGLGCTVSAPPPLFCCLTLHRCHCHPLPAPLSLFACTNRAAASLHWHSRVGLCSPLPPHCIWRRGFWCILGGFGAIGGGGGGMVQFREFQVHIWGFSVHFVWSVSGFLFKTLRE